MYIGKQFGNYRLLRLLGEGGFAHVYLGEHIHLKTQAAVNTLTAALSMDEVSQFRNEARLMMEMDYPHIIRVLDFGLQGHIPFLVMSYAPSGSLRTRHPKGTRLSLPTVVEYVNQIASALQYIHDRKLIHRDVKPENMLIMQGNVIALSDFGIAVMAHSERSFSQQNIGGTGVYMAPELFDGKPRTASDQYALAIVAYEWLTGAPPFGGSLAQLAYQHAFTPPPSLCEQIPVLRALERVILKALAKDPLARFSTVQEFAYALEDATRTESIYPTGIQNSDLASGGYLNPAMPMYDDQRHVQMQSFKSFIPPSSPIVGRQPLSPTEPATPFHTERIASVFVPPYSPLSASLPKPKRKKRWVMPIVSIMGALLLICAVAHVLGTALLTPFLQTNGSGPGGSSTTIVDFLNNVEQQDYKQAYSHLDPALLLVMSEDEFAKQAQSDDRCYGHVVNYTEVANSETVQKEAQGIAFTLTRSKFSRPYKLSFTLHKDFNSGGWLIYQYGAQNDLGPAPPAC